MRIMIVMLFLPLIVACTSAPTVSQQSPPPPVATAALMLTAAPTTVPTAVPSPTVAPSEGIDPVVQIKQLGRGVNFGNALEAPNEGDWGMTIEESFFDRVKEGGFQTIRLPTKWSAHALAEAPYTIDPTFFERIDWMIEQANKRGLHIVINMHHYDELMMDPKVHGPRFVAMWEQIADRYKDQPASVLFELCNEPRDMLTSVWERISREALAAVRTTNPTRNIVIGGTDWNSIRGLLELRLPEHDKHLIATFHYYAPFEFTHQGAEWSPGSDAWLGKEWKATSREKTELLFDLDRAATWSAEQQRPVWLGEFGAYSKADMASRARWTSFLAREAEKRGITWAYWEFGAGFGVYDRTAQAWNEPLLKALVP